MQNEQTGECGPDESGSSPAVMPACPVHRYDQISAHHRSLMAAPAESEDFQAEMQSIAADLHALVESSFDVALFQTMRRDPTDDAAVHSFSVALICGSLAHRLGMSYDETLRLIAASLTMNIAMIDLQRQLWSQVTPLTNEQREKIRLHPQQGRRWLEALNVTDTDWLRGVEEHHETHDGTGYPRGIRQPSPIAHAIRYTDTYCAMLGARAYRTPLPANQAARRLYMLSESSNDRIPAMIIEEVGIFPPGNYVRLANGETAIVVRRGTSADTPRVMSLADAQGEVFPRPQPRDTAVAPFSVADLLPLDGFRQLLDPHSLFAVDS